MTPLSKKQAGVCLHLTSLPGDYGIGQIGNSAIDFINALASMDLSVWQVLPTGPTAFGDSPYQALSAFAGNELLIGVDSLIELNVLRSSEAESLHALPQHAVDYGRLIPLKNQLLELAAKRFPSAANSQMKSDYDQFLEDNDRRWLHDYAVFRALKTEHNGKPWPQWDQLFARRDASAIATFESDASERIGATKVLQFLFHHQWRQLRAYASENNILLFGDMPIYIALDSADAWAHPGILQMDRSGRLERVAGVPPDYFSDDGQLWGNPLYAWKSQAADGFTWWINRMRSAMALVDLVRIDHFRGLESFWSVPAAAETARHGRWEPGPRAALFDAMQKAIGELPIVAEDLGVITAEVESLRRRYDIPGMSVLQFELAKDDFDLAAIEQESVCYTATHDNDTTLGWFNGGPGDTRTKREILATQKRVLELTQGRPETIHNDLIKFAFNTDAKVAIAPMQDFLGLGSEARLNTPGTSRNNWRWRLLAEQLTGEVRDSIAELTASSGRDSTY